MKLIRSSFLTLLVSIGAVCSSDSHLVLRAELLSPSRLVLGAPIYVRMTLVNAGERSLSLPFHPQDHPLYMRTLGPDGTILPYGGSFVDFLGCTPIPLEPKQLLSAYYNASGNFLFDKPGTYTATVVFNASICTDGSVTTWGGTIESSPFVFTIDPLPAREEAAYQATLAFSFGQPGWFGPYPKQGAAFLKRFPDSVFAPYVRFALGERYVAYRDYKEAIRYFRVVSADPTAPLREFAAERLKRCQEALARREPQAPASLQQRAATPAAASSPHIHERGPPSPVVVASPGLGLLRSGPSQRADLP